METKESAPTWQDVEPYNTWTQERQEMPSGSTQISFGNQRSHDSLQVVFVVELSKNVRTSRQTKVR